MKKILITGDIPDHLIRNINYNICHIKTPESNKQIINELKDSNYYIIGGPEYCSENYIKNASKLKLIIVLGTGTNSFVDITAANEKNIRVMNIPEINAHSVAEFALGAILMRTTRIHHSWKCMQSGQWFQKPYNALPDIIIGFVGMGNINKSLLKIIRNFNERPMYYNSINRNHEMENQYNVISCNLIDMFNKCDIVVISITYNSLSHHLIDRNVLSNANPELDILCFSSPNVISPSDLLVALTTKKIRSAYMDGYYNEWLNNKGIKGDKFGLLSLEPDIFMATTHIAAQTKNVITSLFLKAIEKIKIYER